MLPQFSQNYDEAHNGNYPSTSRYSVEKRSRSRSRDRKRRKSKRHHRSRSGSRERSTRVHVNPLFGGGLGPSASALLQTNERLEIEVQQLRQENGCVMARINPLETQLRNTVTIRQRLEQQLSNEISMKNKLQLQNAEILKKVSNLERQVADVHRLRSELEESKKKSSEIERNYTMQTQSMGEQNSFYRERNQTLTNKCEELLERCRAAQLAQETAENQVQVAKRDVDILRERIETQNLDLKRVQGHLNAAREKETVWVAERNELEKKMNIQNSLLAKSERQSNKDREEIDKLKNTLRSSHPAMDAQLGLESLFRAFEVLKEQCSGQIKDIRDRVEPLTDSCKRLSELENNVLLPVQPIRVRSAPPILPSLDLSFISTPTTSKHEESFQKSDDVGISWTSHPPDVKHPYDSNDDIEKSDVEVFEDTLLDLESENLPSSTIDVMDEEELLGI